jgi:hypothetical protein
VVQGPDGRGRYQVAREGRPVGEVDDFAALIRLVPLTELVEATA